MSKYQIHFNMLPQTYGQYKMNQKIDIDYNIVLIASMKNLE